jgi:5-methylcytosine-specific restriction endonuclease McrA
MAAKITSTSKKCTACEQVKPLTLEYYHRRGNRPLGFMSRCRLCVQQSDTARSRKRYANGPGRIRRKPPAPGQQACTKCKTTYPATLEFFGPSKPSANGLTSWCRVCVRERARLNRAKLRATPDGQKKILVQKQRYAKSPRGRETKRIRSHTDNHKRRQRRLAVPFKWQPEDWQACLAAFGNCCEYCDAAVTLHQDHFIPLSDPACPGTIPTNMVPACQQCNLSKGSRHPHQWVRDQLRLVRIAGILAELD